MTHLKRVCDNSPPPSAEFVMQPEPESVSQSALATQSPPFSKQTTGVPVHNDLPSTSQSVPTFQVLGRHPAAQPPRMLWGKEITAHVPTPTTRATGSTAETLTSVRSPVNFSLGCLLSPAQLASKKGAQERAERRRREDEARGLICCNGQSEQRSIHLRRVNMSAAKRISQIAREESNARRKKEGGVAAASISEHPPCKRLSGSRVKRLSNITREEAFACKTSRATKDDAISSGTRRGFGIGSGGISVAAVLQSRAGNHKTSGSNQRGNYTEPAVASHVATHPKLTMPPRRGNSDGVSRPVVVRPAAPRPPVSPRPVVVRPAAPRPPAIIWGNSNDFVHRTTFFVESDTEYKNSFGKNDSQDTPGASCHIMKTQIEAHNASDDCVYDVPQDSKPSTSVARLHPGRGRISSSASGYDIVEKYMFGGPMVAPSTAARRRGDIKVDRGNEFEAARPHAALYTYDKPEFSHEMGSNGMRMIRLWLDNDNRSHTCIKPQIPPPRQSLVPWNR